MNKHHRTSHDSDYDVNLDDDTPIS